MPGGRPRGPAAPPGSPIKRNPARVCFYTEVLRSGVCSARDLLWTYIHTLLPCQDAAMRLRACVPAWTSAKGLACVVSDLLLRCRLPAVSQSRSATKTLTLTSVSSSVASDRRGSASRSRWTCQSCISVCQHRCMGGLESSAGAPAASDRRWMKLQKTKVKLLKKLNARARIRSRRKSGV